MGNCMSKRRIYIPTSLGVTVKLLHLCLGLFGGIFAVFDALLGQFNRGAETSCLFCGCFRSNVIGANGAIRTYRWRCMWGAVAANNARVSGVCRFMVVFDVIFVGILACVSIATFDVVIGAIGCLFV